jgi:fumarate hydratase, class II
VIGQISEQQVQQLIKLRELAASEAIVKIGRTNIQEAVPLTLGQEWSGYVGMLSDNLERMEGALQGENDPGSSIMQDKFNPTQ